MQLATLPFSMVNKEAIVKLSTMLRSIRLKNMLLIMALSLLNGSAIMLKYDGMIRATGVLVDREKSAVFDERDAKYGGYYLFDVATLHYLAYPIDKNSFRKSCPEFIGFN